MYSIGVDIGGMSIKVGLVNNKGEVLNTFVFEVDRTKDGNNISDLFCKELNNFINGLEIKKDEIKGIGVGFPGPVDTSTGILGYASNLNWEGIPLKDKIEHATGISTRITNDANAATLGEALFGAGKQYKNIVMLTLGTGVGGGVIVDGKLLEGTKGKGAELGHITLVLDGLKCGCGRNGCFEQYASATALMRQAREAMELDKTSLLWNMCNGDSSTINGKHIFDAEKQGDKTACEVVDKYIKYLSEGILNYCNIFRPEAVVLSGGIAKQGKYLTDKINEYCKKFHYGYKNTPIPEIIEAKVGYQSGIVGAAALYL